MNIAFRVQCGLFSVIFSMAAVSQAVWTVLDDFSGNTPITSYMAYDSDTAAGRDVVCGLDDGRLKPIKTIIRAGYAGGFWWTGGEVLKPGDSVKVDIRLGGQNVCEGFRFSKSPFGKTLAKTDNKSDGTGTVAHGKGTVYAGTYWVNVYQRAGETEFKLTAGTGGTGQGGCVADGVKLVSGAQPTTDDFFTLAVSRGTGANQNVLTWSFEGNYFSGNQGVVAVAEITADEGLYFALNLNGSNAGGRFDNLTFGRQESIAAVTGRPAQPGIPVAANRQESVPAAPVRITKSPVWSESDRSHRLIIGIPDSPMMDKREVDERPAIVDISFTNELSKAGFAGKKPDLSTLRLVEFDPDTGNPVAFTNNAVQKTPADRPVRWYDGSIPFNFPDFSSDISTTGGTFTYNYLDRWGYFYETVGDWKEGRIGWVHTQRRGRPSCYAAYFNLMDEAVLPPAPEPRGMIGDGINRTEERGDTSTGQLHTRVALDDWNGDGLLDIITGCARGQITWWPNSGTAKEPAFIYSRMVFMEDGKPLDVGMQGVPAIADWDGDGLKDLIISSNYKGRLNFFKNTGSNTNRVFVYRGFLKADGGIIESPFEPNPEGLSADGAQGFKRDYYSYPAAVDWNGDGRLDLLTGGYVTGRIFLYKNTGTVDADGLPVLTFEGPVMADGSPLDVGWSAAPAVADFNNDGKFDLISGLWSKPGLGGVIYQPGESFLRYFKNTGTRTEPLLTLLPVPKKGDFPAVAVNSPAAGDFNHDGLIDLVVGAGLDIYLIKNIGTAAEPSFDAANIQTIRVKNGSSALPIRGRFQDITGDGHPDIVDGITYSTNTGEGYPFRFAARQSFLPSGVVINHPVQQGDGWRFYHMTDFDCDGKNDVLFGDFWGQVWFHRNLGTNGFDTAGVLVADTSGKPIRVGPDFNGKWDFTTMQGARIIFTCADFNGDGLNDIMTRDTLGNITLFERNGPGETVMKPGVVISRKKGRGFVYDVDWNGDGRMDVYLPGSGTRDIILLNAGSKDGAVIWTEEPFERPGIPVAGTDTSAQPVDLNEDGDMDVLISNGYRFTSLFEKTFLKMGYAQGQIIMLEHKPAP